MRLRLNRSNEAVKAILESNDFTIAGDMMRKEQSISSELRELIALKITGGLKGKRGPKKKSDTGKRRLEAQRCMDWLVSIEGFTHDRAVRELQIAFNVSERTVYEWLSDDNCAQSALEKSALDLFQRMADGHFGKKYHKSDINFLMPQRLRKQLTQK